MVEERTANLARTWVPWHREAHWLVIGLEAVILIAIGGFILLDKDTAGDAILQLIGVVLLATSFLLGWASLRNSDETLGVFDAFRAGVAVTAGVVATASWWSDYIAVHAVRIILGWALIAYGLLHVIGLIAVRGRAGLRPNALLVVGLTIVLGIVLLTGDDTTSVSRLNLLGTVLLAFGALLGGLAYYLYTRSAAIHSPTGRAA
jgi:uncharacterized membrane protein HdeD (DUF308 family)